MNSTFYYFQSSHGHAIVPGQDEAEARALLRTRITNGYNLIPENMTAEQAAADYAMIESFDEDELERRADEDMGWGDFQFPTALAGRLIQLVGFDTRSVSREDLAGITAVAENSALAWVSAAPYDAFDRLDSKREELLSRGAEFRDMADWLVVLLTQAEVDESERDAAHCPVQAISLNRSARKAIAQALEALKSGDSTAAIEALQAA